MLPGPIVGLVFLALAAWFVAGSPPAALPDLAGVTVHESRISTAPRRTALTDPPRIHINGFDRTCMECHRTFPSNPDSSKKLMQHTDIVVDHGPHGDCLACHHREDRDKLAGLDGRPIPFSQTTAFCAECHERVFHEWVRGSHGRSNGYWDETRGERTRLTCTQCHDPHRPKHPAMDPIEPLPPPKTLRMGEPSAEHAEPEPESPLRRALLRDDAESGGHR
ncbi:MAG: hypothetical protein KDC38_03355 [Planctomycetes bacterium]|nr:hypothetical protein [Planctomycetota bacterium]